MGLCLRRLRLQYPLQGWQGSSGISGSFQAESVATFDWNRWQVSTGISGNLRAEYAVIRGDTEPQTIFQGIRERRRPVAPHTERSCPELGFHRWLLLRRARLDPQHLIRLRYWRLGDTLHLDGAQDLPPLKRLLLAPQGLQQPPCLAAGMPVDPCPFGP